MPDNRLSNREGETLNLGRRRIPSATGFFAKSGSRRWRCLIPALSALFIAWGTSPASADHLRYRERVGAEVFYFTWRVDRSESIRVRVQREAARFVNRLQPDGDTLAWAYRSDGIDVQARRRGNRMQVWGRVHDAALQKQYAIDNDPWYQPLSYSLRTFLQSDQRRVRFWTIRLDELAPVKLKATKKGTELVDTPAGRFEAQKVEVRVDGWLAFAWHGTYWYRRTDGLFLKYSGVNGLPGTPRTVVELAEILS